MQLIHRLLAATATSLLLCTGCSTGDDTPTTPSSSAPDNSKGKPFELSTHCGVHELEYLDKWYARHEGPLDDGKGGAPDGWDDPTQKGYIVVEGGTAVFRDDAGHREAFVVREGATKPLKTCS